MIPKPVDSLQPRRPPAKGKQGSVAQARIAQLRASNTDNPMGDTMLKVSTGETGDVEEAGRVEQEDMEAPQGGISGRGMEGDDAGVTGKMVEMEAPQTEQRGAVGGAGSQVSVVTGTFGGSHAQFPSCSSPSRCSHETWRSSSQIRGVSPSAAVGRVRLAR
jgi:hypothetical protein